MNDCFLDFTTRALGRGTRRRDLVAHLAAGALAFVGLIAPADVMGGEGTRRKKRKKKPLQRNEYGCVPIGKACRGNDSVCCSGICEGRKPKKGERDRTFCVAHDTSSCVPGEHSDVCGGATSVFCTTSLSNAGICETTTGNAGYCVNMLWGSCQECRTDADCQVSTGNSRAACVVCSYCAEGTFCVIP